MAGNVFSGLLEELQLRVAVFLEWHEACAVWGATSCSNRGDLQSGGLPLKLLQQQRRHWRSLISALIDARGHDEEFLADLSTLQDTAHYRSVLVAYAELHPDTVQKALMRRHPPERLLDRIFACDDVRLLQLLLDTYKRLRVDGAKLVGAVQACSVRCLKVVFDESRPTRHGDLPRVQLDIGLRQKQRDHMEDQDGSEGVVDFRNYPQNLLWQAAFTRDDLVWVVVLQHLKEHLANEASLATLAKPSKNALDSSTPSSGSSPSVASAPEDKLRYWAACCGAASGHEPLLHFAGSEACASRVSFMAPAPTRAYGQTWSERPVSEAYCFEEAPLAVVACSSGRVNALRHLSRSRVDLNLVTRRGLSALDVARRQTGDIKKQLLDELHSAGCGGSSGSRPSSSTGSRPPSAGPLAASIERADVQRLTSLVQRGARLEACDMMSAVRSGDLDVLAVVQAECKKGTASLVEYRQMVRQTALQIRAERNGGGVVQRSRSSPAGAGSVRTLRQAGNAVLGFKSGFL